MTEKGTNDVFVHGQPKSCIRMHVTKHLVFKTDQETSLITFLENVAADLKKEGINLILEQSPVGNRNQMELLRDRSRRLRIYSGQCPVR